MIFRTRIAAGVFFSALAMGLIPAGRMGAPAAQAQNLGQRVIEGTVQDADSAAVTGATVFLRNTKTKSIRSYTSTAEGKFRFAQVNMNDEFDLWAEKEGKKSASKTISAWDTRKAMQVDLRLK